MHIVLFCATQRGYRFLQRIREIKPDIKMSVVCFREEAWEPPFFSDIRRLADDTEARFLEAKRIDSARWHTLFESEEVDLILAVNWRFLIPSSVYQSTNRGAFVFHDSLLPQYRGFSPTVWTIINGENQTGVTLFEMSEEVDAGDIVDQERVQIDSNDRIGVVMDRVTEAYLVLLERNLDNLLQGEAARRKQDESQATFTCKLLPDDCLINWRKSTREIYNLVRAYTWPYPGAYTRLDGCILRIWEAVPCDKGYSFVGRVPGRVVDTRIGEGAVVLTGDGALFLNQVQLHGGQVVSGDQVLTSLSMTLE
jgi:methionyl-tRNA formyltransferase